MANLRRYGIGPYHLEFRFDGQKIQRSLATADKSKAKRLKALVEETFVNLKRGVIELPAELPTTDELWHFVISGGKVSGRPKLSRSRPLSECCTDYLASYPDGAKESSTLKTERLHLNHLQRLLGKRIPIGSITVDVLQECVHTRQNEKGVRGKTIQPTTITKELQTFGLFWKFAVSRRWVRGSNPAATIPKPRRNQKAPFMTYEEIEARISRGGLSEEEQAELWDSLFLRESEIGDLLAYVKEAAPRVRYAPYIYPAIAFCAYTGARRSEMFRCHIDDVNDRVMLREKKRSKDQRITFREVPLHPDLKSILDEWLCDHPGGQFLFCKRNQNPLEDKTSRDAFDAVMRRSRWQVIRGYHVLRHSFASNLARHGVDQYKIDDFMGHQTEEMRRR